MASKHTKHSKIDHAALLIVPPNSYMRSNIHAGSLAEHTLPIVKAKGKVPIL